MPSSFTEEITSINDLWDAAEDANKNGYILSLSEVVETALIHAISEYTMEQEVDFLQIEIDKMEIERQKQQEKEDLKQWEKDLELYDIHMKEMMDLDYKNMEKEMSEAFERKRLEQLEEDKNALLTLNPTDLKKYLIQIWNILF